LNAESYPTVSILVTVYNREAYLAETLRSILDSTFTDFEVIVVDDCSSDGSLALAKRFALQDGRIRVYANASNLGDYGNRNKAASLASGKYLKYLDADDVIYKSSLSTMVEALDANSEAALALSSNVIDPPKPYPQLYQPAELYRAHFLGRSPLGVGPSAAIIRRDSFLSVNGFSHEQHVSDTELWLKLAERWPVVVLPPALVWWRQHDGQQHKIGKFKPSVLTARYKLELKALYATTHLCEDQKEAAGRYLHHIHARRILSTAFKGKQFRASWSLIKTSDLSMKQLFRGFNKPAPNCPDWKSG